MATPLIGATPPVPKVNLENHHKMLKLRRLSDRMIEVLAKKHSYDRSAEIQMIEKQRKELAASMPPLRLVSSTPSEGFKLCA